MKPDVPLPSKLACNTSPCKPMSKIMAFVHSFAHALFFQLDDLRLLVFKGCMYLFFYCWVVIEQETWLLFLPVAIEVISICLLMRLYLLAIRENGDRCPDCMPIKRYRRPGPV